MANDLPWLFIVIMLFGLGIVILLLYLASGITHMQISEDNQIGSIRIRFLSGDMFNGFIMSLLIVILFYSLLKDAFFNLLGSGTSMDFFITALFWVLIILAPLLIYRNYCRGGFVIFFYNDSVEIRDRIDVAWIRWKSAALNIPFSSLQGFYVNQNALFIIINGVYCKIYSRWPLRNNNDLKMIGDVINNIGFNYGVHLNQTHPKNEQSFGLIATRKYLTPFRHPGQKNSFTKQKIASKMPNSVNQKLLKPEEKVLFYLKSNLEKIRGKKYPEGWVALTPFRIIQLFDKDHYRLASYDQVEGVEINQLSINIRFKK